jgi:hypothetical protein
MLCCFVALLLCCFVDVRDFPFAGKQGNTMVRWLLTKTVHHAARRDPELRQDYQRVSSPYYSFTIPCPASQPLR